MTITATAQTTTITVTPGKFANITNDKPVRAALTRIKELKALEAAGAAAERERKALEAEVILPAFAGGEALIVLGQTVAKLSSERKTVKFDHDTLKEAWPAAWQAIRSESPYRFVQYS